jgi:hypothetical protein
MDAGAVASRVSEARPLLTLTTTGASDPCNSGRNACRTRTVPKTFVSNVFRINSAVTSAGPITTLLSRYERLKSKSSSPCALTIWKRSRAGTLTVSVIARCTQSPIALRSAGE